ncbi:MAG: hypothetical protein GX352_00825, partial [Clostridiales bacterium]|nr:hypothetical protein [Clostridiales bacterium]
IKEGSFITDITKIDRYQPGEHKIKIKAGLFTYSSVLRIEDTIPPLAQVIDLEITYGQKVVPQDFIGEIIDVTPVEIFFDEEPDFSFIGEQEVRIGLQDAGGNITTYTAKLSIAKVYKLVTVEIGTKILDISLFLRDEGFRGKFITDVSKIDLDSLGFHDITVEVDGEKYSSQVEVIDTTAPTGSPITQETWAGDSIEAASLVENIFDYTEVSVFYKAEPDFNEVGTHRVPIILEDTSGNIRELWSTLVVKADTEPPVIKGVEDRVIYIDEKVSYKRGVEVTDNRDEKVELVVDSSNVNLKKTGAYEVIYSAVDEAGNSTVETAIFTVKKKPSDYVDPDELDKMTDRILDSIIKDGMSDKEKLKAIFDWTTRHISYTGSAYKDDWMMGAARGIKRGSGDCFTYYATARALLTRAGFENMCVTRIDKTHYWNLVKYNGDWYHFDTCYRNPKYYFDGFLRTDEDLANYTKKRKDRRGYYNFDKSLYPPTPKTRPN